MFWKAADFVKVFIENIFFNSVSKLKIIAACLVATDIYRVSIDQSSYFKVFISLFLLFNKDVILLQNSIKARLNDFMKLQNDVGAQLRTRGVAVGCAIVHGIGLEVSVNAFPAGNVETGEKLHQVGIVCAVGNPFERRIFSDFGVQESERI